MVAERKLIEGLRIGREDAYRNLLEQHGSRLLQTCCLILKDKQEAEDVVQETFIRVFKGIHEFKGNSSLYTWLYRIAVNISRDRLRKAEDTLPLEEELIIGDDLESKIVGEIDREALRSKLYGLASIYREVLVLYYFKDFSITEISEILGDSEGTIKSRLSRGRKLLGESLLKGGMLDE